MKKLFLSEKLTEIYSSHYVIRHTQAQFGANKYNTHAAKRAFYLANTYALR